MSKSTSENSENNLYYENNETLPALFQKKSDIPCEIPAISIASISQNHLISNIRIRKSCPKGTNTLKIQGQNAKLHQKKVKKCKKIGN